MSFIRRYISHGDPLVAACNLISLVLGYNTPLYPLYLLWLTGKSGLPWSLLTLCACPIFLAVPAVARLSPLLARLMLPIIGALNTILCTWLFGVSTGTELFFLPCLMLAPLLFRPEERLAMGCAALLPCVAFFVDSHYADPRVAYDAVQAHAILRLNAGSVGFLSLFIAFVFARALSSQRPLPDSTAIAA